MQRMRPSVPERDRSPGSAAKPSRHRSEGSIGVPSRVDQAVFSHPRGEVELTIRQRNPDALYQALLSSDSSYVMLGASGLDAERRKVGLDFVSVYETATNGLETLSQVERETTRLEFDEMHAALRRSGLTVLSGALVLAIFRETRDQEGVILDQWTERMEMTVSVITDSDTKEATMLVPSGMVGPFDEERIEPTTELGWSD